MHAALLLLCMHSVRCYDIPAANCAEINCKWTRWNSLAEWRMKWTYCRCCQCHRQRRRQFIVLSVAKIIITNAPRSVPVTRETIRKCLQWTKIVFIQQKLVKFYEVKMSPKRAIAKENWNVRMKSESRIHGQALFHCFMWSNAPWVAFIANGCALCICLSEILLARRPPSSMRRNVNNNINSEFNSMCSCERDERTHPFTMRGWNCTWNTPAGNIGCMRFAFNHISKIALLLWLSLNFD